MANRVLIGRGTPLNIGGLPLNIERGMPLNVRGMPHNILFEVVLSFTEARKVLDLR